MLIERCTEVLGVTDSEASSNIATTALEVVDKVRASLVLFCFVVDVYVIGAEK